MGKKGRRDLPFELSTEGKIPITKIEAAVRQLETAIELWFNDGDLVSINTLTFAGHELLYQLNKKNPKGVRSILDGDPRFGPKGVYWADMIRLDYIFAKHGGGNPDEVHHMSPGIPPLIMKDATDMYAALGFCDRAMFFALTMRLRFEHPDMFIHKLTEFGTVSSHDFQAMKAVSKKEFLETILCAIEGGCFASKGSTVLRAHSN